jgi:PAS domain S-box-containing protein
MATETRKTGIDVVGDMPWGTHFCLFYETKEDLLATLVPYIKAGLESQEFCLWVVSEPLREEEARHALKQAVPDFDRYLGDHSIEIVLAGDWYLQGGTFDLQRVTSGWHEKLAGALARGYDGVRVTGDTAWLEKKDWKNFCEYEEALNTSITNQCLTVLCTYPLAACGASEILDVARTHQSAIAKRQGSWEVIEAPELSRAKAEIQRLNEELEQRVAERTSQLTAVNEQLRKEIATRKRAEEALSERASLLDLTHDTVFVRDMADVITYWNRGAAELYGWTKEEAVGRVSHQLMQTIFPAPLAEISAQVLCTGRWEGELIHTRRDGTPVTVASRWALQRDASGNPAAVLETNNDITERQRAEEALRESERRYRHIFQTVGVSIWEEDFSQLKAAIDDLKSQGVEDLRQYLAANPQFVHQAISMVKIVDVNDVTVKLFAAESKDELLVSLHKVFVPETQEIFVGEMIAIAEGRTSFEAETVLQTLKGERLTALFTITFPPPPARCDSVLVTVTDITERKRAEQVLRHTQVALAHLSRVMTLGALTASIAHEVNQPLAGVVTNGQACLRWLAREAPDVAEARAAVERIVRDGHRASEVIRRIRAFTQKAEPQAAWLDINEVIQEVIALVHGEVRTHRVALWADLSFALPPVLGDRIQLQQVMLNLLINGIEAMHAVTERVRELQIRSYWHAADEVGVAVRDAGIGLDPGNMDRLFDAFFTTKPGGMGMGLAISRTIIEAHGGRLWAAPNEGHGMTFQFILPTGSERVS